MNAMIYIRGNRADYDGWRDAHGATGWGYDDVLPYFIRAEGNPRLGRPFHGQDGPLHVEDRRYTHRSARRGSTPPSRPGCTRNDDFNGAEQEGAGLYQVTCRKGRRWSTAKAYLSPRRERPNLTVQTGAFVERVRPRGQPGDRRARTTRAASSVTAYADAEVVLCGGAVNSPQLLMLSGIGPAEHLRGARRRGRHDLAAVGQNLHDHPAVPLIWHTKDTTDLAEFNTLDERAQAKARARPADLQRR